MALRRHDLGGVSPARPRHHLVDPVGARLGCERWRSLWRVSGTSRLAAGSGRGVEGRMTEKAGNGKWRMENGRHLLSHFPFSILHFRRLFSFGENVSLAL